MTERKNQETHASDVLGSMSTGVRGFDVILGGGLARGAIYLVMGRPGTGKTTLGNQLCFSHVAGGGRAVYLTLLAESHASMIRNLQGMRFFDASAINESLFYVGGYRALRDEKLNGLLHLARRLISDERASLLVIDGISPPRAFADSDVALKEFIVELQMLSVMTDCTTVLLSNMTAEDANGPEHTMVDGLIELSFERAHRATFRTAEVMKHRGSRHLLGRHTLTISGDGISVYPRIEEVLGGSSRPPAATQRRVSSGVAPLDGMLDGGILSGTTSIVLGFAGSGKTTLALQFLDAGVAAGENALYFGFYESPARLLEAGERRGLRLRQHAEEGRFNLIWQPPHEYTPDILAARLLEDLDKRKVRRLVIDGLDGLRQAATDPARTIRFMTALCIELRARDVTTLITDETAQLYGPEISMRVDGISALADNLLVLEYMTIGTELRRLISVIKHRGSAHDTHLREFSLTARGMEIAADASSAEEIMVHVDIFSARRNRRPRPPSNG